MENYIQIPPKNMRRHKRHFQLLELMVAAFILLICIAPMMQIFTSMYKAQQQVIRENQRDHLAHVVHTKFTERLYNRQISLETVLQGELIVVDDSEIQDLLKQFSYDCTGTFGICKSHKVKDKEKPVEYLCKMVIKMKDKLYKPQETTTSKKQETTTSKKYENTDPSETIYDYYVYIDTKPEAKKAKNEESNGDDDPQDDENSSSTLQPNPSFDKKHGDIWKGKEQ